MNSMSKTINYYYYYNYYNFISIGTRAKTQQRS